MQIRADAAAMETTLNTSSASLYRNLACDSERDFATAGLVSGGPMLVVAHPALPASIQLIRERA